MRSRDLHVFKNGAARLGRDRVGSIRFLWRVLLWMGGCRRRTAQVDDMDIGCVQACHWP
jgi:hypothetical protein